MFIYLAVIFFGLLLLLLIGDSDLTMMFYEKFGKPLSMKNKKMENIHIEYA